MQLLSVARHYPRLLGLIPAIAMASADAGAQPVSTTRSPLIEIRVVFDAPAPDRTAYPFEGRTLFLGPPLLSDSNIVAVDSHANDSILHFTIYSSAAASDRFYQATSLLIGQHVALLVENRIWEQPPVVQSAIRSVSLVAGVRAPNNDLKRLARLISERWPAKPPSPPTQ
jgi:hypothetical protein